MSSGGSVVAGRPIEYREETSVAKRRRGASRNATFILPNQDHTLGNILRHSLVQDPRVSFCGYRMPHPLEPLVELRLSCLPNNDEATTTTTSSCPKAAVIRAIEVLCTDIGVLGTVFTERVAAHKLQKLHKLSDDR